MSAIDVLFQNLSESEETNPADVFLLRRRIGSLQRWRFSVHLEEVRKRFEEVALRNYTITTNVLKIQATEEGLRQYLARINTILTNWQRRSEGNVSEFG